MDAMVTARVPSEIREQGVEVLHEIGANTTDLINSAFRYVIHERKLPESGHSASLSPGRRVLSADQERELRGFLLATAPATAVEDARPFEDLLDEAMGGRHADLYRH